MAQVLVSLELNDQQAQALVQALSFHEQLCRGDLDEVALLMEQGILVPFMASNEQRSVLEPAIINQRVRPLLQRASSILGYPPGARLTVEQGKGGSQAYLLQILQVLLSPGNHQESAHPYCVQHNNTWSIRLDLPQTNVVKNALDVYVRVCLGQLSIITESVLNGEIPCYAPPGKRPKRLPSIGAWGEFNALMIAIKKVLGFAADESYGIWHAHVHISALRGWEIRRSIANALAQLPIPNKLHTTLRGLDSGAANLGLTDDPPPLVRIVNSD